MYMRAVVPIYDDDYKYVIGCSGRSIYNWTPKWIHSKGVNIENVLYNYWFAKEFIKKTKTAIIVESPGNIWKLEEAGIHNAVALMGGDFSVAKQWKLDRCGVCDIIVVMDCDPAGGRHARKIIDECSRFYNIKNVQLTSANDLGEMSIKQIREELAHVIN